MELFIPKERPQRAANGQFLPGHKGLTKGRPRCEWMSEESDIRLRNEAAKRFREQKHPENAGVPKRKVVLVTDKGKWFVFPSIREAARRTALKPCNIGRCCRQNASRRVKQRKWTKFASKQEGELINTDHKFMGVRWYFEDDDIWTTKINQQ